MSRPVDPSSAVADKDRVRRLVALPGVRPGLRERLQSARVAVVGVGGLGNASALYLAGQGVGHLRLIDPDVVEGHNLGRQILFGPSDVGRLKVEAAQAALSRIAPMCRITAVAEALDDHSVGAQLADCDVVLDGLDAGRPRDILNRWSVESGKPVVFAGAIGYEAQVFGVRGGQPCLTCLFGPVADLAEDCAVTGVLGPVVGMAGTVQAQEALKLILEAGTPLVGRLWTFDAFAGRTRIVSVPGRPDCPVCGGEAGSETGRAGG